MGSLSFAVAGAQPQPNAALPTLNFRLRLCEASGAPVHAILLRCQLQIQARRRAHSSAEQDRLLAVFGEPARWSDTLHPLIWTQSTLLVPAFEKTVEVDMPVPCTYDFDLIATKYLHALDVGEIPLLFLFSGTVFHKAENGFRIEQVPWDKEAATRLPVRLWRDLMDSYFPDGVWIRLRRESLDALERFKASRALVSWDEAIAELVKS